MKKFRPEDFWFELTQGPDPVMPGRQIRVLRIECRDCGQTASMHPRNMAGDVIRKHFVRAGWSIGKTRSKHVCPACNGVGRVINGTTVAIEAPPPAEPPPTKDVWVVADLEDAWTRSNEEQRIGFCMRHRDELAALIGPTEPEPVPMPEPGPEPVPDEPEPDDGDDEPADWWKELMAK